MGRSRKHLSVVHDLMVNLSDYYDKIDSSGGPNACWPWQGPSHRQGYGMFGARRIADDQRIMIVVHRLTARLKYQRAIASNEMVIHECGTANCQNPAHITLGNAKQRSAVTKSLGRLSRSGAGPGPRTTPQNRNYRLTIEQMRTIRDNKPQEAARLLNMPIRRVYAWKTALRKNYAWLNRPEYK